MKQLINFEAFKLNKVQMNEVKGGAKCSVHILSTGVTIDATYPSSMTKDQAYHAIQDKYEGVYDAGDMVIVC